MVRRKRHGKYASHHKAHSEQHHALPAEPASYMWYYSSSRVRTAENPRHTTQKPRPSHDQPSRSKVAAVVFAWLVGLSLLGLVLLGTFTSGDRIITDITGTFSGSSKPNECANNASAQQIVVSIGQRHMWACDESTSVYDSPVVTGRALLAADATPTGTYHIYAKQTDQHLIGSDTTGSWDDYVYYWMPFLDNQYGQYGFHDATWRPNSAFGNISPDSNNGSHGCVEMPLAAAKWLYSWAQVGTPVKIEN